VRIISLLFADTGVACKLTCWACFVVIIRNVMINLQAQSSATNTSCIGRNGNSLSNGYRGLLPRR